MMDIKEKTERQELADWMWSMPNDFIWVFMAIKEAIEQCNFFGEFIIKCLAGKPYHFVCKRDMKKGDIEK